MLKEIPITGLKPGMYVVDTGLSWTDRPFLYSREGVVESTDEIQDIIGQGYASAFVDTEKNRAVSGGNDSEHLLAGDLKKGVVAKGAGCAWPLSKEIETARKLYADSVGFVKNFMSDVRLGKRVNYEAASDLAEDLVGSVMRNEDALITMKFLKSVDEYTYRHSLNVSVLATIYGKYLGMDKVILHDLCLSGLYHDVGKACIPLELLNKPGKLTEEEFAIIRAHSVEGYDLLVKVDGPSEEALRGVLEHHEKYDGNGYPDGLAGDEISEYGKIIAVADVYDALTSVRAYKIGMPPPVALKAMFSMRKTDFYPQYVERFIKCLGIYPVGSLVQLSDGRCGVVVECNKAKPLLPVVRIAYDKELNPVEYEVVSLDSDETELSVVRSLDNRRLNIDIIEHLGCVT